MPVRGRRWQAVLIIVLFFVAVAAAAFTGWWYARESPPHQGPIVLISADNLAPDRLAPYGAGRADTPAIDALATDGVVFDRAYAHSPQTLPSFASILSGQLPFEHGVRDDAGFAMKEEARTLAELLRNRGFNTGAAVSTFLLRPESGVAQGFSFFDAELPEPRPGDAPVVTRDATLTLDAAERWMRTQEDQRYLLFVQVDDGAADEAVGRIVQELKGHDLYDEATIVLVGDHGDDEPPSLADTSLHVPLIVKQPDSDGAGRRVAAAVQHIDLLPTILDLVRAPIPSDIRGRSLRDVLDHEDATIGARQIYAESMAAHFRLGGYPVYGVTSDARRYIRGERDEIFDLERGGRSLAVDSPEAERLRGGIERLAGGRAVERPRPIAGDDVDAYAALGYLPGLRLPAAAPIAIDPQVQAKLMATHRIAAHLVAEKKYAAAIERLRSIVRAQPALAVVHYQIGSLLLRTARYREAAATLAEAARLQPDSPGIAIARAATALQTRDYDLARSHAEVAVALADALEPDARAAAHDAAMRVALARLDGEAAMRHAAAAHDADAARPLPDLVRRALLTENDNRAGVEQAIAELMETVPTPEGYSMAAQLWTILGERARADAVRADARARFRGDPALVLLELVR